jgi:aspartyl-tRNA(Asn)/glutamyl-tRNA(Gln) amidotransferase subunit B
MRSKEGSDDYRYFQDPDLPVLVIDEKWIGDVKKSLPELPDDRKDRIAKQFGLPLYDATVLTDSTNFADYFETVADGVKDKKLASNWIMVEVLRAVREQKTSIGDFVVSSKMLAELLQQIESGVISGKMAKEIFEEMVNSGRRAIEIINESGLKQITDTDQLAEAVNKVLAAEQKQVEKYRAGKTKLFGFFVGQVMKATRGKANPELVNQILREKLNG